jgi:hypothetical protein
MSMRIKLRGKRVENNIYFPRYGSYKSFIRLEHRFPTCALRRDNWKSKLTTLLGDDFPNGFEILSDSEGLNRIR